jgi:hypothetical protein
MPVNLNLGKYCYRIVVFLIAPFYKTKTLNKIAKFIKSSETEEKLTTSKKKQIRSG